MISALAFPHPRTPRHFSSVRRTCLGFLLLLSAMPIGALAQPNPASPNPTTTTVAVPFVGCSSDGQTGPIGAPERVTTEVRLDPGVASRLAFYKEANGIGILGPRGWHCIGLHGSNGQILIITPRPVRTDGLLSANSATILGPAIQLSISLGDTSGRFSVARVAARIFPSQRAFVQRVIDEGIEPASYFPFGVYPQDRMTYRSERIVEFETPAHSEGLGTTSRLVPDDDPIRGVAILAGRTPDLLMLAVRLPADSRELAPVIIQQLETSSSEAYRPQ